MDAVARGTIRPATPADNSGGGTFSHFHDGDWDRSAAGDIRPEIPGGEAGAGSGGAERGGIGGDCLVARVGADRSGGCGCRCRAAHAGNITDFDEPLSPDPRSGWGRNLEWNLQVSSPQ